MVAIIVGINGSIAQKCQNSKLLINEELWRVVRVGQLDSEIICVKNDFNISIYNELNYDFRFEIHVHQCSDSERLIAK